MAKNDVILLDDRLSALGLAQGLKNEGAIFDLFVSNQILKLYDISAEEVSFGTTDGENDGGIDMWYVFVNGQLLDESSTFPKSNCYIEVVLITCKHAAEFSQEPINIMFPSISELFDLTKTEDSLDGVYNEDIKKQRRIFFNAYKKTGFVQTSMSFSIYYASRGDSNYIASNVRARAMQVENLLLSYFSNCEVRFNFYGAEELMQAYRYRPNFDLSLPITSFAAHDRGSFVALSKLSDYYKFITDEKYILRKYLFDSNVRDYLGSNIVNDAILNSLENEKDIDFWFLNNGITILASNALSTGSSIQIKNVQIVNGLQTSYAIYRYFSTNKDVLGSDSRTLVVKIISQDNKELRDKIIRSTNNQTAIQLSSLFATDKLQLDIEEYLLKQGYYYERRKNCYDGMGIDYTKMLDVMSIAKGYACIIGKSPESSTKFKQKRLMDPAIYNFIFKDTTLKTWENIANVLCTTDRIYRKNQDSFIIRSEGFFRRTRGLVQLLSMSIILEKFDFFEIEFDKCDMSKLTDNLVMEVWNFVASFYDKRMLIKRGYMLYLCIEASKKWKLKGIEHLLAMTNVLISIGNKDIEYVPEEYRKYLPKKKHRKKTKINNNQV